jgi:Arc/MetJ-type ribon-helix-helix transcriptional regulator
MTVTLKPRIAEYAQAQVRLGNYATPDEAINQFIEEQLEAEESTYEEIEASLLKAVREPTVPYREGEFVELIEKIIAERQRP